MRPATCTPREVVHELGAAVLRATGGDLRDDARLEPFADDDGQRDEDRTTFPIMDVDPADSRKHVRGNDRSRTPSSSTPRAKGPDPSSSGPSRQWRDTACDALLRAAPSPSESRPASRSPRLLVQGGGTAPGLGGWRCRRTCTPT